MTKIGTATKKKITAVLMAATFLISGAVISPLQAATATSSFLVTATVLQTCIVAASPLAFGSYDPASATPNDTTTAVLVTCTNGTAYNVGLNAGTGTGGTTATRKMTSGSNHINYTMYSDSGRSTVWGNTVSTDTVAGTATGLPVSHTIYGRISALQAVAQGVYTDTVTVTVTY